MFVTRKKTVKKNPDELDKLKKILKDFAKRRLKDKIGV